MEDIPRSHAEGKIQSDTVFFNDSLICKLSVDIPHKVHKILIYTGKQYIHGLEIWYSLFDTPISSGRHIGESSMPIKLLRIEELELGDNEYLSSISGVVGNGIEQLKFTTTKGRTCKGGPIGMTPTFEYNVQNPDWQFTLFAMGVGSSLQFLEFSEAKIIR